MAVGCRCLLVKLNEYLKSQQTNGFRNSNSATKKKHKKQKYKYENARRKWNFCATAPFGATKDIFPLKALYGRGEKVV